MDNSSFPGLMSSGHHFIIGNDRTHTLNASARESIIRAYRSLNERICDGVRSRYRSLLFRQVAIIFSIDAVSFHSIRPKGRSVHIK